MKRYIRAYIGYDPILNTIAAAAKIGTPEFDEQIQRFYPNLDSDKAIELIAYDPTYQEGSDSVGKYGRWILTLANKNKGNIDNIGHLTDVLTRFDNEKNNLINKDIMKYKSIDEVDDMLNDDSSYKNKSHRQEVRDRQKARKYSDLNTEADLVYSDNNWEVWVPKTYSASCKLGQGTRWCTASTESDQYYKSYTKKGNLYILMNKSDPSEKYQFHFKSNQFMNKDDHKIDLNLFLDEDHELRDYFMNIHPNKVFDLATINPYLYTGEKISENLKNYIKEIIIDDSVTSIGWGAFSGCTGLISILIPDSVTSIGFRAFSYCSSLTSVTIPDSVTEIGDLAFARCSGLTSITIPDSVTSIGGEAFEICTSLTSVTIPDGVTNIESWTFSGCSKLTSVTIPDSVTNIEDKAFYRCDKLIIKTNNPIAIKYCQENDIPYESDNELVVI